jgi:hypothetical protein
VGYYAAPASSSYALSIAPPGKCAVDWAPVQNAEPSACVRFLGADFAELSGFCAPKCASGPKEYMDCKSGDCPPGWRPYGSWCAPDATNCPPGWKPEGGVCLPPCQGERSSSMWCEKSNGTCPIGHAYTHGGCVASVGRIKEAETSVD